MLSYRISRLQFQIFFALMVNVGDLVESVRVCVCALELETEVDIYLLLSLLDRDKKLANKSSGSRRR